MSHQLIRLAFTCSATLGLACASTTPGARPHDMSAAHHDSAAAAEEREEKGHANQYDPSAKTEEERCGQTRVRGIGSGACWTSVTNPTAAHQREAEEHRKRAADHRAASAALRSAEAGACGGIAPDDRDTSPFSRTDDIVAVTTHSVKDARGAKGVTARMRVDGVVVTFRAVPGMTAEWLQRIVDCHIARNSALGHTAQEMPDCPLVPKGVTGRVTSTGTGFAVTITASTEESAEDVVARAQRLRPTSK